MISADIPNFVFSVLTVVGQVIIIIGLVVLLISWKRKKSHRLLDFSNKHAILFAFIVALIAMTGSLTYSELVGYEPCKLCWFQRILMYPQVLILGLALLKKDRKISDYIIPICIFGIATASYHYLLQRGVGSPLICGTNSAQGCSQALFMEFGYITIPMMSLTAFSMILLFMMGMRLHDKLSQ